MATMQTPSGTHQLERSGVARRSALESWQKKLCLALGIALMVFGCFSFVRYEPSWPAAVPLLAGAVIFGVGLLGQFVRLRFGPFAVEPSDTDGSREAVYPTSAPEEQTAEQTAPPPTLVQPDLVRAELVVADEGTGSEAVHVDKREPFAEALTAFDQKDYSTFDSKMLEAIDSETDEDSKVALKALRLERLYRTGQTNRMEQLQALRQEHPESPFPIMRLGDCYELAGEHEKAAALYGQGSEIAELRADHRLMLLGRRAEALRKAKLFEDAEECLHQGLQRADTDGEKAEVEKLLAELYEDWGKKHETLAHFEKALELNPGDVDARFKLAYGYSEAGYELAAFHHYAILRLQQDGAAELNNLAIIMRSLDMPLAAARYYRKAADQGNSQAAANLARVMLNSGLVEEARRLLGEALNQDELDEAVHRAYAAISQREEAEKKRLEVMGEAAVAERSLLLERFELERQDLKPVRIEDIEGTWQTSVGEMTFKQRDTKLVARFKDLIWDWKLVGQTSGRTYSFTWTCDRKSQNQEGDGFFIFRTDKEFEGIIRHTPQKGQVRLVTGTERKAPTPSG